MSDKDALLLNQEVRRYADALFDVRLGGIESRLSEMHGVFERVVKNEEKLLSHLENDKLLREQLSRMDSRIGSLENAGILTNAEVSGWIKIKSGFYIALAGAFAAWVWSQLTGKS